jgi:hypothetical protein
VTLDEMTAEKVKTLADTTIDNRNLNKSHPKINDCGIDDIQSFLKIFS